MVSRFSARGLNRSVSVSQWTAEAWLSGTDALLQSTETSFSTRQKRLQRAWIALTYLGGLALWVIFLDFGRFQWGVQDWVWEWRYSRILQEAVTRGVLPLHTEPAIVYGVARFLGVPDVPLSLQIPLLRFLDTGAAFLIHWLVMHTVSFAGCLLLRSRLRLSVVAFTAVAALFNFNGFITSHLGIGHTLFIGYFIFPFFVLLVLDLVQGRAGRAWFARMALALFGMELLGTTQLYAACVIFLGVLMVFTPGGRAPLFKSLTAGVLLHAFRIGPAALSLSEYAATPLPGHLTVTQLVQALVWIVPANGADKFITGLPLGWWELDVYVGILGFLWIMYFGVWRTWRRLPGDPPLPMARPFGATLALFGLFSLGYLYWPINYLPVPLLKLVHVPSRFFILPLLFLVALAARQLQVWWDHRRLGTWERLLVIVLLFVVVRDLIQHALLWRIPLVYASFPEAPLDYTLQIAARSDPVYVTVLLLSSLISLATLAYVLRSLLLERRSGGSRLTEKAG